MTNEERAQSVELLATRFAKAMGIENEDAVTIAGDLICNLLHWVQAQCDDTDESRQFALDAARSGIGHYVTETNIDYDADVVDELGPDAFVEITVDCNGANWSSRTGAGTAIVE